MQLHYQMTVGTKFSESTFADSISSGPHPLLLLHGLFGSGDNWGSIVKLLAPHIPVISVDLRNHGRSPHHDIHTYLAMAEDVLALCDHLQLPQIHLLGHSMGGKVAMQFASQYPQRLRSLIVADMAMRAYPDQHSALIDAMLAVDLSQAQTRRDVDLALTHAIPAQAVRQFLLTNLHKVNDHLHWRLNLQALRANYRHLQSAIECERVFTRPALFVYGEHSDYVTPADRIQLTQHFSRAHWRSLPAGHWLHAEQPQLFAQAVLDFLQTL